MIYFGWFLFGSLVMSLVAFAVDASKAARDAQSWYVDDTPIKEDE